jgi:hypothetical protein
MEDSGRFDASNGAGSTRTRSTEQSLGAGCRQRRDAWRSARIRAHPDVAPAKAERRNRTEATVAVMRFGCRRGSSRGVNCVAGTASAGARRRPAMARRRGLDARNAANSHGRQRDATSPRAVSGASCPSGEKPRVAPLVAQNRATGRRSGNRPGTGRWRSCRRREHLANPTRGRSDAVRRSVPRDSGARKGNRPRRRGRSGDRTPCDPPATPRRPAR